MYLRLMALKLSKLYYEDTDSLNMEQKRTMVEWENLMG